MDVATDHLASEGWTVADVSLTASYDLHCIRDGEELRVEVKGTLGAGERILVTANEVANARDHHPNVALLVVSEIEISAGPDPVAGGGNRLVISPWSPSDDDLRPLTFSCRVHRDV